MLTMDLTPSRFFYGVYKKSKEGVTYIMLLKKSKDISYSSR